MTTSVEDKLARSGDAKSGSNGIGSSEVKVLLLIMPFRERRLDLVTKTKVDSETGVEFPVVLDISPKIVLLGCKLGVDAS